jgi:cation:H+ antiporter
LIPAILILLASFVVILAGSELFTNGVEWAGHRFHIAEAAVGSLLAAVGTALPETFIPAVALLMGAEEGSAAHNAVGVGAIIGAPLMLSTVALFVMGVAGLAYRKRRHRVELKVSRDDARRDLAFFIPIFLVAVLAGLAHLGAISRHGVALGLLVVYGFYAVVMLRLKRHPDSEVEHGLYLELVLRGRPGAPRMAAIVAQVVVGVMAILVGAREFVEQIVRFSAHANLNPGVVSLILSPLATELPEKYNSVVWIRQRKDHLALANITGAMVFQSCFPVALGIAFTPWTLTPPELLAASVALVSTMVLFVNVRHGELRTPALMVGGAAYATFIAGLALLGTF